MTTFKKVKEGIPKRILIPTELEKLCDWLDQNSYPISGEFSIHHDDGKTMGYWLGFDNLSDRFGIFGIGPDGSLFSIWLDDNGNQKIVHLGSEGEELYILSNNFLDFLRLLAIGYDEIGSADLDMSAKEWNTEIGEDENKGINTKFQEWVKQEFNTTIQGYR